MHAENSYARKLILFLGAVLLLAAPIQAQTQSGGRYDRRAVRKASFLVGHALACHGERSSPTAG